MERSELRGEDVIISLCAREECVPGKHVNFYAKEGRRYYALHYIVQGSGFLSYGGGQEALRSGDLFIIPPGIDISYEASERWEYYWVNIEGKLVPSLLRSIGLTPEHCRMPCKTSGTIAARFMDLVDSFYLDNDPELKGLGMFYLLLSELHNVLAGRASLRMESKRNVDYYIREALTYLNYNLYYTGVTLDSVAKSIPVNKNYLCTIFREKMGMSPMQYLIKLRMEAAAKRFEETDESVSAVAKYVGYKDPLHFSKAFHMFHGVSPTEYRRCHNQKASVKLQVQ